MICSLNRIILFVLVILIGATSTAQINTESVEKQQFYFDNGGKLKAL